MDHPMPGPEARRVMEPIGPLLRGVIEAFQVGIVLVDPEGQILMANETLKALLGYTGQSLIGRHVNDLIPPRLHARHAEHMRAYAQAPREYRRMGSPLPAVHANGTEVLVSADLIPLEHDGMPFTMAVIQAAPRDAVLDPDAPTHGSAV